MPQKRKGRPGPPSGSATDSPPRVAAQVHAPAAPHSDTPAPEDTLAQGESSPADQGLPFPIVAIGASAGGIEAIRALLEALPADTGMAFVILQHLSPTHGSMLAEILSRATRMPVREARSDMAVERDHVYVIPPNRMLAYERGMLELSPREGAPGHNRPIDDFMRSLAENHAHKSIGVVLSGTANDGTLGLQEIKGAGGITFAQDATAEQASMPRSAIAAGVVDFVLPPDEIARELRNDPRTADIFIVAVTGYGRDDDRARSSLAGIDVHMTKPVDIDALMEQIANRRSRATGKG